MRTKKPFHSYLLYWLIISGFLSVTMNACEGISGRSGTAADKNGETAAPGKWTMAYGDRKPDQPGVYGTKGTPALTNTPGARNSSISWIDNKGNLWLFGGDRGTNGPRLLNDLWKFDGTNWTWVSGDDKTDRSGVYGTKGVADAANKPGARYNSISWTDKKGNLWLFGGMGYSAGLPGILNDLWKFDGTNWTWVSGDFNPNEPGEYGTKGVASETNVPGPRHSGVGWTDSKGNLWLFGGNGYARYRISGYLNDLWKFDGTNWTWVSGDKDYDRSGVYGSRGSGDSNNKPGSRYGSVSWTDSEDNLWLFGGMGYNKSRKSLLNDLWKFDGTNWTWIFGNDSNSTTVRGNGPAPRRYSVSWSGKNDTLWLFGGSNLSDDNFNDLWKYEPYKGPSLRLAH